MMWLAFVERERKLIQLRECGNDSYPRFSFVGRDSIWPDKSRFKMVAHHRRRWKSDNFRSINSSSKFFFSSCNLLVVEIEKRISKQEEEAASGSATQNLTPFLGILVAEPEIE